MLRQQQNLGRRLGASGVHLGPPVAWAAVRSVDFLLIVSLIVEVCGCSMFCCALLCVRSSVVVVLVGGGGGRAGCFA